MFGLGSVTCPVGMIATHQPLSRGNPPRRGPSVLHSDAERDGGVTRCRAVTEINESSRRERDRERKVHPAAAQFYKDGAERDATFGENGKERPAPKSAKPLRHDGIFIYFCLLLFY